MVPRELWETRRLHGNPGACNFGLVFPRVFDLAFAPILTEGGDCYAKEDENTMYQRPENVATGAKV